MGRRTILLIVAALIAIVGAGMVFLYVQGADDRAKAEQAPVEVLKAVAQIEPGETLAQAQAAGKLELAEVPTEQLLDGAMASIGDGGAQVALTRVFPNEQVTASKFGSPGEQDALTMPEGEFAISVNLSDTGRVAGFVNPGSSVAVFLNGPIGPDGEDGTRLLLPEVQVIGGRPDHRHHRHHDHRGRSPDHRAAAPDAVHARRRPGEGGEAALRIHPRRALLRAAQRDVRGASPLRARPRRTSSGDLMPIIVESNPASAELFLSVSGAGTKVVGSLEELRRTLAETADEYAVVLGPTVELDAAAALADNLRVTRPAVSVILMRRRVDTSVLAEALRSGMREVVEERDLTGPRRGDPAGPPGLPSRHRAGEHRRRRQGRQAADGLLPQGRGGQDHDRGQPRGRARQP